MTEQERKRKKAYLLSQSRVILDKITFEGRAPTKEEEAEVERLQQEAYEVGLGFDPDEPNTTRAIKPELPEASIATGGRTIGQDEGGRDVRAFAPNERLSDGLRFDLPDGIRRDELDLGRYVRALVSGDWSKAAAERRVMQHQHRTMNIGTPTSAGILAPDPIGAAVIDYARTQTRVIQAGAQTVPMTSKSLGLIKVTGVHTPHWVGENEAFTTSEMTFGLVNLQARKQGILCKVSIEAWEDATNLSEMISDAIAKDMAVGLDFAALYGSGAEHEPLGLKNTTGIQTIDCSNGALTDYSKFAEAWQKIQEYNGPAEGQTVIMHPELAGDIDQLQEATEAQPLLPPPSWASIRKLVSTQVSNATGTGSANKEAFQGVFSEMVIGVRTALEIEAFREAADSSSSAATHGQVWVRCYWRGDVAVRRPSWFVHIQDIA